jgi:hypothetical protein
MITKVPVLKKMVIRYFLVFKLNISVYKLYYTVDFKLQVIVSIVTDRFLSLFNDLLDIKILRLK